MGVIKSNKLSATLSPFSMRDIEQQAQAIILRARQQAEQLLAAAQSEGEALRREAHARGLKEGISDGRAKGAEEGRKLAHQQALEENRKQFATLMQSLAQAAERLDQSRRELESQAAGDVVRLAVAIARRVTKRQAASDPQVLSDNVREAMKMVVQANNIRIAIHPDQRAALEEALPALQVQWPSLAHVELMEDASVGPGGCRIHAGQGYVDAELDGQIERIAAELLPTAQEAQP